MKRKQCINCYWWKRDKGLEPRYIPKAKEGLCYRMPCTEQKAGNSHCGEFKRKKDIANKQRI